MTREQQKAYNAENYPASVLTWLNGVTDMVYDDFESRTCEWCKYYEEVYNEKGWKTHTIMQCSIIKEPFSATFGCNKYEPKESKDG